MPTNMEHSLVYTLADLEGWLRTGRPSEESLPARLAVLGDPVAHSRSPAMHQAALDARGLALRYIRLHVKSGEIAAAFELMQRLGFVGCNVTVPHKQEALRNCDVVAPLAECFQAVNTVTFGADGHTYGDNTDGPGLSAAILEAFGKPLASHTVAILGAGGGAGRAAALQCAMDHCPRIVISNRTWQKALDVAAEIARIAPQTHVVPLSLEDPAAFAEAMVVCDLLVNATSLGLAASDPLPCPRSVLRPDLAVYDMIYNPPETALLAAAKDSGALTSNGLSMLVHQGAIAFNRWFGGDLPVAIMRRTLSM